jgi:hypothetical protein
MISLVGGFLYRHTIAMVVCFVSLKGLKLCSEADFQRPRSEAWQTMPLEVSGTIREHEMGLSSTNSVLE